jgi:DNA-binding transcriptional ArsR family regulator
MVALFAVLSNVTRLKLLLALEPGTYHPRRELCVCDLAAVADASQSMTSHQLRLLREAGLVVHRREGKLALYRLADGPMRHLLRDALEHVRGSGIHAQSA